MSRTPAALVVTIAALAALTAPGQAQQRPQLDSLKTVAESSDYRSTSTYAEVLGFMNIVADASPLIHLTSYGTTYEGRMMPLAVVGTGLADGSAAAVKASGKLRVHIQGNIHAGEVEDKEATLRAAKSPGPANGGPRRLLGLLLWSFSTRRSLEGQKKKYKV